jgi:hypothetical protein
MVAGSVPQGICVLWMSVTDNTLQEYVSYRCRENVSYRKLVQKDVKYRQSVIDSTHTGRRSVIGSIPSMKDVSSRQYHTGRWSVKGSNPEGRMSVIGSTIQEGGQLKAATLKERCQSLAWYTHKTSGFKTSETPTGRMSVKGSNHEGKMSVIGSTLQEGCQL